MRHQSPPHRSPPQSQRHFGAGVGTPGCPAPTAIVLALEEIRIGYGCYDNGKPGGPPIKRRLPVCGAKSHPDDGISEFRLFVIADPAEMSSLSAKIREAPMTGVEVLAQSEKYQQYGREAQEQRRRCPWSDPYTDFGA